MWFGVFIPRGALVWDGGGDVVELAVCQFCVLLYPPPHGFHTTCLGKQAVPHSSTRLSEVVMPYSLILLFVPQASAK